DPPPASLHPPPLPRPQHTHPLPLLLRRSPAPEPPEVLVHGLGQLVPYYPRPLAFGPLEERRELALAVCPEGDGNVDGRVRHRPLGGMRADAPAVGDRLHQRVATEPAGAVHGDAGSLARGAETAAHVA